MTADRSVMPLEPSQAMSGADPVLVDLVAACLERFGRGIRLHYRLNAVQHQCVLTFPPREAEP